MTIAQMQRSARNRVVRGSWALFTSGFVVAVVAAIGGVVLGIAVMPWVYQAIGICVQNSVSPNTCDPSFVRVPTGVMGLADLALLVATVAWGRRWARQGKGFWWVPLVTMTAMAVIALVVFIASGVVAAEL